MVGDGVDIEKIRKKERHLLSFEEIMALDRYEKIRSKTTTNL